MKRSDFYRKMHDLLLRRRTALRQMLSSDVASLGAYVEAGVIDEADASLTGEQLEIDSQLAEVESRELGKIDEALARFTDGSYGSCETCTKAIHVDRLTALPYANQCIKCAQANDSRPSFQWHSGARDIEADVA